MKLAAKANIRNHRQQQSRTGGGEKPPLPSQEDQQIMAIAPHDFIVEINEYDSDALLVHHTQCDTVAGPSCEYVLPNLVPDNAGSENLTSDHTVKQVIADIPINEPQTVTKETKKRKDKMTEEKTTKDMIIQSNIRFKKRHLEMLETEHSYNIEIAKLKIKKLELEIEILEHKNNK